MFRIMLVIGILFTLHSNAWGVSFNLGRQFENMYDYNRSVDELIRIIEQEDLSKPENRNFVLATLYVFSKDTEKAKLYYKKTLKYNESFYISHIALGSIYLLEGQTEEALEHMEKALKIAPKEAITYNALSVVYLKDRQFEEAKDVLEKGITMLGEDESLRINQSLILISYFQGHREQKKIARNMTKILKTSDNVEDFFILGSYYAQRGEIRKTRDVFKRALELEPENVLAILAYAETYVQEDNYEKALEIANKALELEPGNEMVLEDIRDMRKKYKEWKEKNKGK